MKDIIVKLNSVDKVKDFVNKTTTINKNDVSMDLISGRYIVDATSILGIFSLDLSKNLTLRVNGISEKEENKAIEIIKEFIV